MAPERRRGGNRRRVEGRKSTCVENSPTNQYHFLSVFFLFPSYPLPPPGDPNQFTSTFHGPTETHAVSRERRSQIEPTHPSTNPTSARKVRQRSDLVVHGRAKLPVGRPASSVTLASSRPPSTSARPIDPPGLTRCPSPPSPPHSLHRRSPPSWGSQRPKAHRLLSAPTCPSVPVGRGRSRHPRAR